MYSLIRSIHSSFGIVAIVLLMCLCSTNTSLAGGILNTAAVSKYDAGVSAMERGECTAAKALFNEAIAMDPHDRAERVGMFTIEYYPNARLNESEAKCPSQTANAKTASSVRQKSDAQATDNLVSR